MDKPASGLVSGTLTDQLQKIARFQLGDSRRGQGFKQGIKA